MYAPHLLRLTQFNRLKWILDICLASEEPHLSMEEDVAVEGTTSRTQGRGSGRKVKAGRKKRSQSSGVLYNLYVAICLCIRKYMYTSL